MTRRGFEMSSRLPGVSPARAWEHVSSWEGVNFELGPFIQMTQPGRYPRVEDVPADGTSHFTSIFLAFGVLPVEAHRFALRAREAPAFFDEVSSNLLMRSWHHRRTISAYAEGVEVRDACRIEARLEVMGWLLERIYAAVFRHRHRRLRKLFADAGAFRTRPSARSTIG